MSQGVRGGRGGGNGTRVEGADGSISGIGADATPPPLLKRFFEVDYIGNETYVASQNNILLMRSQEPVSQQSTEAKLSARGLHHRSRPQFARDFRDASAVITNAQKAEKGKTKGSKVSPLLMAPFFQRALACERLSQLERAISDYSVVLSIDNKNAAAYFNRSGLYLSLGNTEAALDDINKAIAIEPMNVAYRTNKALMLRQSGGYMEAINETMICRAVQTQPEFVKRELDEGKELVIDSSQLKKIRIPVDPIITVLSLPQNQRTTKGLVSVMDFLASLKFFASFASDYDIMLHIAQNIELRSYQKDSFIFEEGMIGMHFYMLLDGEVSIVKCKKKQDGDILSTVTLVKLFRGQTFGETALEKQGGTRSAGALASQPTHLLELHVDIYKNIVSQYKSVLRAEARTVLSSCPAFADFDAAAIDTLAEGALLRSFASNIEIVKARDKSKHLYIVKQGIVKLIKAVQKPRVSDIKVNPPESTKVQKSDTPGLWVLGLGSIKDEFEGKPETEMGAGDAPAPPPFSSSSTSVLSQSGDVSMTGSGSINSKGVCEFVVGVIGSGQIFGELSVLSPGQPSPFTAISFTPVEIYVFDGETVLALGAKYSTNCMSCLTESVMLHNPPTEKLAYYYRAKYVSEKQRLGALATVLRPRAGK